MYLPLLLRVCVLLDRYVVPLCFLVSAAQFGCGIASAWTSSDEQVRVCVLISVFFFLYLSHVTRSVSSVFLSDSFSVVVLFVDARLLAHMNIREWRP